MGSLRTTDGGQTWTLLADYSDIGIVDGHFTHATYEGSFVRSLDSTKSWENIFSDVSLPTWFMVVRFADSNNGVAGCGPGLGLGQAGFVHTSDGGKTWHSLVSSGWIGQSLKDSSGNIGKGIIDICFASSTIGYALADSKISTRSDFGILKTRNSGTDWTFLRVDTALHFYSDENSTVYFKNENVGYIIDGKVFKTTTGGEKTVSVQQPLLKTFSPSIYPNPFKNSARIKLPENFEQPQLRIFTTAGDDCTHTFKSQFSENSFVIERKSASAGMYYFTIESKGKLLLTGNLL
ncbi:MAG TPA: T9SS type A sorting domain-containing protein [Patescibacteria group bacterium]|nr:T9SS type A sorting domain-containing protein [Patescibacteria group bacterium]